MGSFVECCRDRMGMLSGGQRHAEREAGMRLKKIPGVIDCSGVGEGFADMAIAC